jgi:hypothetical protein
VERLLLEVPAESDILYQKRKTYLCTPLAGIAAPGVEPEHDLAGPYHISEIGWFDLRDSQSWGKEVWND